MIDTAGTGVVWRTSPWDHLVHGFAPDMIGELTAQALCDHSALAARLTQPHHTDRKCLACLLLHGDTLAGQIGETDRYAW